ncbi:MAG: FeoC-like transcriptional regulator [bacterium]
MILREISNYIKERDQAPLRDLALHFRLEESVARDMVQKLIDKGRVEPLPTGTSCSGCNHCPPESVEIFKWVKRS